jgi:hypothetical protein
MTKENRKISFNMNQKNPEFYSTYEKFLQSFIVEHVSIC